MTTESSASRTPLKVVGVAVGAAVLVGALASFNGFPGFVFPQTMGAVLLLTAGLFVAIPGALRGLAGDLVPGIVLALGAAYVAVRAAVAGTAAGFDEATLFFALAAAATLGTVAGRSVLDKVGVAVVAGGVLVALVGALQYAGVEVPAPIPFVTDPVPGRATFDDPWTAGTWFGVLAVVSLVLRARGALRVGGIGLAASAIGMGLASYWPPIIVTAIALTFGVLIARRRPFVALLVPVAAAIIALATPVPEVDPGAEAVDAPRVEGLVTGDEWPYDEPGAVAYYRDAAATYAAVSQPLGGGPGAFVGEVARHADTDSDFAVAHVAGVPTARRAPNAVLELAGDYGGVLPALLLLAFALSMGGAIKRRSSAVAVGVAGLGLVIASGGLLSGGVMVLLGFALALGTVRDEERPGSPPAIVFLAGLALLGVVGSVHAVQTLRWGVQAAGAVVHYGHARLDDGAGFAAGAATIQRRHQSEVNAALALYMAEERDLDGALEHLETAVELRPASVQARGMLADLYVRRAIGAEDRDERLARARRMFDVLTELDPNNVRLAMARANSSVALFDHDEAVAALEAAAARPIEERHRVEMLVRLGEIHEDAADPESARTAYRRALAITADEVERRRLADRVDMMSTWMETGVRPLSRAAHGHGQAGEEHGPDDGHGH